MAILQSTYDRYAGKGLPGDKASGTPERVDSAVAEATIAFGSPVRRGNNEDGARHGARGPLGESPNVFGTITTANKAAAETLRDSQATSDAAWLSTYSDDRSKLIWLLWDTGSLAQRRNAAGAAWEDIDPADLPFNAQDFMGVALSDRARSGEYSAGDNIGVISEGDVWVEVAEDVNQDDRPVVILANGTWGKQPAVPAATHAVVPARYMSSAASGEVARLRLFRRS